MLPILIQGPEYATNINDFRSFVVTRELVESKAMKVRTYVMVSERLVVVHDDVVSFRFQLEV